MHRTLLNRNKRLLAPITAADMRTWRGTGGFSVDGSVRIEGEDRAGLERLVRYCARGPLALGAASRPCRHRGGLFTGGPPGLPAS